MNDPVQESGAEAEAVHEFFVNITTDNTVHPEPAVDGDGTRTLSLCLYFLPAPTRGRDPVQRAVPGRGGTVQGGARVRVRAALARWQHRHCSDRRKGHAVRDPRRPGVYELSRPHERRRPPAER